MRMRRSSHRGHTLPTSCQPYFRTTNESQLPSQPARLDRSLVARTHLRVTSTCGNVCAVRVLTRPTAGARTAWKGTSNFESDSHGAPKV